MLALAIAQGENDKAMARSLLQTRARPISTHGQFRSVTREQALLLLAWTALILLGSWRCLKSRLRWSDSRLGMTNDLIERMVGHRTRLAQEAKAGRIPAVFHASDDPGRLVPLVWKPEDYMIAVTGDLTRNSVYIFAHNGVLGYPTAREIKLPPNWKALRSAASTAKGKKKNGSSS